MDKKRLIRCEHIQAVQMGEDLAMLNENTGKYVVLNDIGKEIWELIDGRRSMDEIVKQLLVSYEVSEEVCIREVDQFVKDLIAQKIIERK